MIQTEEAEEEESHEVLSRGFAGRTNLDEEAYVTPSPSEEAKDDSEDVPEVIGESPKDKDDKWGFVESDQAHGPRGREPKYKNKRGPTIRGAGNGGV